MMDRPSYRGEARCDICGLRKMCTRIPLKLDYCDDCNAEYQAEVAPLRALIADIDFEQIVNENRRVIDAAIDEGYELGRREFYP